MKKENIKDINNKKSLEIVFDYLILDKFEYDSVIDRIEEISDKIIKESNISNQFDTNFCL